MKTATQQTAILTDANGTKYTLLKEWDFLPFDEIKYKLILGLVNYIETKGGKVNRMDIDSTFGFAYTSSSSFAGLWAWNGYKFAYDKDYINFIGFVIDEDLQSFLMFDNEEEKSILIPFVKFAHSELERYVFETNELNKYTEKAFLEVTEYLKQFEGKKILTNSGLSKKIEIPKFQVREKTKYGFIDFHFWIDASFDRTMYLKTKICLNGGSYNNDNFGIFTQFCTYLEEYKFIGSVDKIGVYNVRTETIESLPQFKIDEVRANIFKLKEKEEEIKEIQKQIENIKKNIPYLLINKNNY